MRCSCEESSRIIAFISFSAYCCLPMAATYKSVIKNVNLGLDLQGGFEVLVETIP